jgi:hypothetical protein
MMHRAEESDCGHLWSGPSSSSDAEMGAEQQPLNGAEQSGHVNRASSVWHRLAWLALVTILAVSAAFLSAAIGMALWILLAD